MTDNVMENEIIEVQEDANVDEKKWCVYCHTNKINGKKYFGITSRPVEDRWKQGLGYQKTQTVFWRAISKYTWDGFEHEIIAENLTEADAKTKEIELIARYKTNCHRYNNPSYGYNCTDGGDGSSGWHPSEETKVKIGQKAKVRLAAPQNNPMYGKHHSDETKQKIRETIGGTRAGMNNPMYGKKHLKETRQTISEHRKGKKANIDLCTYKTIYCIELNTLFYNSEDAHREVGVDGSSIRKACKNIKKTIGKHPVTHEPLHWLYVRDYISKDGNIIPGAITLGYITEEQVKEYLNNLKQKEIENYGIMEKE